VNNSAIVKSVRATPMLATQPSRCLLRSWRHLVGQFLAEQRTLPSENGYSTDSSLSRKMRALGPAIEDVEEADVTVVEVAL